jgi:hypothetical protein
MGLPVADLRVPLPLDRIFAFKRGATNPTSFQQWLWKQNLILMPGCELQGALTALLLAGFGAMWQFDLFRRNNFGLLFFLFFLFQVSTSLLHIPYSPPVCHRQHAPHRVTLSPTHLHDGAEPLCCATLAR